jgi:hypothetical protein
MAPTVIFLPALWKSEKIRREIHTKKQFSGLFFSRIFSPVLFSLTQQCHHSMMGLSKLLAVLVALVALCVVYFRLTGLSEQELRNRIKGKRVVVTGASLGIGREIAKEYAHLGAAEIVLVARSEDKLVSLREEIFESLSLSVSLPLPGGESQRQTQTQPPRVHVVPADLSSEEACQSVVDRAVAAMGGIDYLVLNHITNSQYGLWTGHYRCCVLYPNTLTNPPFPLFMHTSSLIAIIYCLSLHITHLAPALLSSTSFFSLSLSLPWLSLHVIAAQRRATMTSSRIS